MTEKAKRRRRIISRVDEVLYALIAVGAYIFIAIAGELICALLGVGK